MRVIRSWIYFMNFTHCHTLTCGVSGIHIAVPLPPLQQPTESKQCSAALSTLSDRFDLYVCDASLSVLTSNSFSASKPSQTVPPQVMSSLAPTGICV